MTASKYHAKMQEVCRLRQGLQPKTREQAIEKLLASNDPMLQEIAQSYKTLNRPGENVVATARDDLVLNDLVMVLLYTCKLIEFDEQNYRFVRGSNATIATILFGSSKKTGGSYNARIQAVKAFLVDLVQDYATTDQNEAIEPLMRVING